MNKSKDVNDCYKMSKCFRLKITDKFLVECTKYCTFSYLPDLISEASNGNKWPHLIRKSLPGTSLSF